ncbi:hypothetical protein GGR17_000020 [Confluentimicrobium naphthalenivorans]|uniref:Uncharacterized protein n=1 Tax=Actibacterium naphthalenivorans TaxID=1614693 RepID=A0A840CA44_9RHOB|nr:hypothetical protein [Actibacterium naphthalenivorans]
MTAGIECCCVRGACVDDNPTRAPWPPSAPRRKVFR